MEMQSFITNNIQKLLFIVNSHHYKLNFQSNVHISKYFKNVSKSKQNKYLVAQLEEVHGRGTPVEKHLYTSYRGFHRFGQAKFAYSGKVLGSSLFLLLPQLPQKTKLAFKVVKINSKIIIYASLE